MHIQLSSAWVLWIEICTEGQRDGVSIFIWVAKKESLTTDALKSIYSDLLRANYQCQTEFVMHM